MKLGIDRLLEDPKLRSALSGRRVALLGHPASVTRDGRHTLDALQACSDLNATAGVWAPAWDAGRQAGQHDRVGRLHRPRFTGSRFSVCTARFVVPRPRCWSPSTFCWSICRTSARGFIRSSRRWAICSRRGPGLTRGVWVLDRPNPPTGRPIEGTILEPGWESFIGVGPMIMRHGLTVGEFARWYVPAAEPGRGPPRDPDGGLSARYRTRLGLAVVGAVLGQSQSERIECEHGAMFSPARCCSRARRFRRDAARPRPWRRWGAPDVDFARVLRRAETLAPQWLAGCQVRYCHFEPTFHKHMDQLCSGLQIHTDNAAYDHHGFKPYRLGALLLKAIRLEYPDYEPLAHRPLTNYETDKLAIDLLAGGPFLRHWVDDPSATACRLRRPTGQRRKAMGRDLSALLALLN